MGREKKEKKEKKEIPIKPKNRRTKENKESYLSLSQMPVVQIEISMDASMDSLQGPPQL